ncbi:MAG: cobalamin-5-phosphate synthase family protein [Rhizobium sp.]|nr:cobalamin-5-phosphate synthase family protein [Rhizobium sp.]
MNITDFKNDLARSLGFLSRLPVPGRYFEGHDGSLARAVRAFPLAGCLIMLPAAAMFAVLLALKLEPLVAAFIMLAAVTLLTGALHEDGLSDTADGIGGGGNREAVLAIMRDSRIGSYGASALILSYGVRAASIAAIGTSLSPIGAAFGLIAAAAASRAAMVWHWSALPPARRDGVAVSVGGPEDASVMFAIVSAAAIVVVIIGFFTGLAAAIAVIAAAGLAAFGLTRYIGSRIGGHTGDTIGASQQCAEMAALAALALCT